MLRALLILLSACATASRGPTVVIHYVYPEEWSEEDRSYVNKVSESWEDLGLKWRTTDDPNRSSNHCPVDWPQQDLTDCEIDIGLYKKTGLKETGKAGLSDRATNESWIDSTFRGLYLLHVVAHEVGHQVLNTWEHLLNTGIMMKGGSEWKASKADLELACKTIRRGC